MTKLGSTNRPAVMHVQSLERADEILSLCDDHGWEVIVGIEPDKAEDVSDLDKLLAGQVGVSEPKIGRNAPCPCGSGRKYKHCCAPR